MNIVDSKLILSMAPVSIKKFDGYKDIPEFREAYDNASIYIIAKRPVTIMRIVNTDSELQKFFDASDGDQSLLQKKSESETLNAHLVQENLRMIGTGRMLALEVAQPSSAKILKGLYILPEDVDAKSAINELNKFSFEELLFMSSLGIGSFSCCGDIASFLTYDVLYVGRCVDEPLTTRFKAHHALQKMLIHEEVISAGFSNSDELVILPFFSQADTVSVITGDASEADFIKAFTNSFSYGKREVDLDCEKALVHGMNPKYNEIRFKDYPNSKDGLYSSEADIYSYTIAMNLILKYDKGLVYGSPNGTYASKIVGDRFDDTVTIYGPGCDYVHKCSDRIFSSLPGAKKTTPD